MDREMGIAEESGVKLEVKSIDGIVVRGINFRQADELLCTTPSRKLSTSLGQCLGVGMALGAAIAGLVAIPNLVMAQTPSRQGTRATGGSVRSAPLSQPAPRQPTRSPQAEGSSRRSTPPAVPSSVRSPAVPGVNSQTAKPDASVLVCYLKTDDGQVMDLSKLCGQRPSATPEPFSPARVNVKQISEFDNQLYGD